MTIPPPVRRLALLLVPAAVVFSGEARACDACNLKFAQQLQESRAGSLEALDLQAAMANQQGLPLQGMGSSPLTNGTAPMQLAQAGARPARVDERLLAAPDAGVSGGSSQVVTTAPPRNGPGLLGRYDLVPDAWKNDPFIDVIERDYALPIPATSYVPQDTKPDKSFTIELSEGKTYIGNGVIYDGFLTNGKVPGPTIIVDEGDIVEMTVVNKGTIPHGASIHSAYTQTSKYLGKIQPGSSGRVVFRCTLPGVYLYHCAPGGHAIPMHVLFGQYGMMVVKPKKQAYKMDEVMGRKPDLELYLVQHEFYASGKDAIENRALYTTFNGKLFKYVEDPIKVRPGDFVRIYFLNVGPNNISTFHIVGICWDYVYWQGHPGAVLPGGQSVLAGPTDSWVIDFRVPPDEGAYTMLTHSVGSAARGAIGLLVAAKDTETPAVITADGIQYSAEQMAEIEPKAKRTISPFKPTSYDEVVRYPAGTREVTVSIVGNSYWPKVVEVEPGTTVRWVNEDVFTYLAGEFAGIHNAQTVGRDDDLGFSTPLLAHGESATHTFTTEGEYDYVCQPHPYMAGKVIVKQPSVDMAALAKGGGIFDAGWVVPLAAGAFLVSLVSLFRARSPRTEEG